MSGSQPASSRSHTRSRCPGGSKREGAGEDNRTERSRLACNSVFHHSVYTSRDQGTCSAWVALPISLPLSSAAFRARSAHPDIGERVPTYQPRCAIPQDPRVADQHEISGVEDLGRITRVALAKAGSGPGLRLPSILPDRRARRSGGAYTADSSGVVVPGSSMLAALPYCIQR